MSKIRNLMVLWKEFNPSCKKSIKDDFQKEKYEHQQEICDYLEHGQVSLASASCGTDIFTGERIADTYCILTDGEYS